MITKTSHAALAHPLSVSSRKMSAMTRNSRTIHTTHRKTHMAVQKAPRTG
jgi:hypothetical protein